MSFTWWTCKLNYKMGKMWRKSIFYEKDLHHSKASQCWRVSITSANPFLFCVKSIDFSFNYASFLWFRSCHKMTTATTKKDTLCVEFLFGSVRARAYCGEINCVRNWFGFLLTVQVPNPRIYVDRVRALWFGTNSIWMPSCMVLCFVHNAVRNPPEAIPTLRQHCDCVIRIDPNTGNVRLRSFRCSEHSLVLPRCPETSLLDAF